jgi:hypothetical protein
MSKILSGLTVSGDLVLGAGSATVEPLRFQNNLATPTLTQGAMDFDGLAFYSVPNTTTGRALNVSSHLYVLPSGTSYDISAGSPVCSLIGSTQTSGITLLAGTTYEFEMNFAVRYQSFGDTTTSLNFGWTTSGTATTALTSFLDYGNNLTGFTTSSSMGSIMGSLATTTNFASPGATGSRYIIWRGKGIIRVTGTGSVKIYPSLTGTALTVNAPTIQANSYFKLTPLGNGTVSTIGILS